MRAELKIRRAEISARAEMHVCLHDISTLVSFQLGVTALSPAFVISFYDVYKIKT